MEILFFILLFIFYLYDRQQIRKKDREETYQELSHLLDVQHTKLFIFEESSIKLPDFIFIPQEEKKAYLSSIQWDIKRKERLHIDNYTCQMCGAIRTKLEVHHLHYRSFKNENVHIDLISLCRLCHQQIHDLYGYNHNDEFPLVKPKLVNHKILQD